MQTQHRTLIEQSAGSECQLQTEQKTTRQLKEALKGAKLEVEALQVQLDQQRSEARAKQTTFTAFLQKIVQHMRTFDPSFEGSVVAMGETLASNTVQQTQTTSSPMVITSSTAPESGSGSAEDQTQWEAEREDLLAQLKAKEEELVAHITDEGRLNEYVQGVEKRWDQLVAVLEKYQCPFCGAAFAMNGAQ